MFQARPQSSAPFVNFNLPAIPARATTVSDHLKVLRESLKALPYIGGVHPVPVDALGLYYDVLGDKYPRGIHLGVNATAEELTELAAACQLEQMDPSYGAVRVMDLSNPASAKFAPRLDVARLLDSIAPYILEGKNVEEDQVLRAEMRKLSVYGPGSLPTTQKETVPQDASISSLVVIFPTAHTGGVLALEHGGNIWTFDAAAPLSATPALAYVAFHNDVQHVVGPVYTGHRVTLTYNLFLSPRCAGAGPPNRIIPAPERAFTEALQNLLSDPTFLPSGGFLAYALAHAYPLPTTPARRQGAKVMPPSRLGALLPLLKGSDGRIRTIAANAGLEVHVKLLYHTGWSVDPLSGRDVLLDDVVDLWGVVESLNFNFPGEDIATATSVIEDKGLILQRGEERLEFLHAEKREIREQLRAMGYPEDLREIAHEDAGQGIPVRWVTHIGMKSEHNRVGSEYIGDDGMITRTRMRDCSYAFRHSAKEDGAGE
ncbi:hypothetical protein C8R44DRAFT_806033 [Mycena epipterygia]|nr:hypothetical protein C8R44DRAFT_806033 [Mycena epipterygia]